MFFASGNRNLDLMFLKVPVRLCGMTEKRSNQEVGKIVMARRLDLKLAPADVVTQAEVDPKTYASLEDGTRWPQERSRLRIEQALRWAPGSIARLRDGGNPTPLPSGEFVEAVKLDTGPGMRSGSFATSVVMSHQERQILAGVRNKLTHQAELTEEERSLLTKFVEDEELRTLHVRIDWLPRAEQLEVSALVNDLHMQIETRRVAESAYETPEYALPNPLPRDGITPDQLDEIEEEDRDDLETAPESDAQTAGDQGKEVQLNGAEGRTKYGGLQGGAHRGSAKDGTKKSG